MIASQLFEQSLSAYRARLLAAGDRLFGPEALGLEQLSDGDALAEGTQAFWLRYRAQNRMEDAR